MKISKIGREHLRWTDGALEVDFCVDGKNAKAFLQLPDCADSRHNLIVGGAEIYRDHDDDHCMFWQILKNIRVQIYALFADRVERALFFAGVDDPQHIAEVGEFYVVIDQNDVYKIFAESKYNDYYHVFALEPATELDQEEEKEILAKAREYFKKVSPEAAPMTRQGEKEKSMKTTDISGVPVYESNCNTCPDHYADPDTYENRDGENAVPTSRVLEGTQDFWAAQEWAEPVVTPDGRAATKFYLFRREEVEDEDGEQVDTDCYPWDAAHVSRIIIDD